MKRPPAPAPTDVSLVWPCDDEGDVVLLGALQPAILDTFRVTITESSCLSLPRFEHFRNIFILASHVIIGLVVIIGFVVVVEFRNLRHVCVVRHALHETYELHEFRKISPDAGFAQPASGKRLMLLCPDNARRNERCLLRCW